MCGQKFDGVQVWSMVMEFQNDLENLNFGGILWAAK